MIMKKFFTLIAAVAMAASVNAQTTLVDYPTSQAGITLHNAAGNITYATVKIHTNTQSVNCIKVAKSFSTDKKVTDDYVELTAEGGFKAGDVVSITGVYNNASEKMLRLQSSQVKSVRKLHYYLRQITLLMLVL